MVKRQRQLADQDYRDQAQFRAALRRFLHVAEEHARQHGITPQQYQLLLAVRGHADYPQVNIRAIAESLQIRHHSASLLVDRCVDQGYLDRREDPEDRRRMLVRLTPDGQARVDTVMLANRRQLELLRAGLVRESLWQALVTYEQEPVGGEQSQESPATTRQ